MRKTLYITVSANTVSEVIGSRILARAPDGEYVPVQAIEHSDRTFSISTTDKGRENFSPDSTDSLHKRVTITNYLNGGSSGRAQRMTDLISTGGYDLITQKGFQFKMSSDNTVDIYIGGPPMGRASAAELNSNPQGIPLLAGEAFFIDITKLSNIYVIASADPSAGTAHLFWLDM